MASIAWWWTIPVVALAIVTAWAGWACRSDRTPSMHASMSDYEAWSTVFKRVRDTESLGREGPGEPEEVQEPKRNHEIGAAREHAPPPLGEPSGETT